MMMRKQIEFIQKRVLTAEAICKDKYNENKS